MAQHYDEKKVLRELERRGVQTNYGLHHLVINPNKSTVGIGSWGKIDFLVKYCGWKAIVRKEAAAVNSSEEEKSYKKAKKEAKDTIKANKPKKQNSAPKTDNGKGFLKKNVNKASRAMFNIIRKVK